MPYSFFQLRLLLSACYPLATILLPSSYYLPTIFLLSCYLLPSGFLEHTLNVASSYLGCILDVPWTNLGRSLDVSWMYLESTFPLPSHHFAFTKRIIRYIIVFLPILNSWQFVGKQRSEERSFGKINRRKPQGNLRFSCIFDLSSYNRIRRMSFQV